VQICLKQSGLWISKTGMEKQFPVQVFQGKWCFVILTVTPWNSSLYLDLGPFVTINAFVRLGNGVAA
jgi:hypothetical protein